MSRSPWYWAFTLTAWAAAALGALSLSLGSVPVAAGLLALAVVAAIGGVVVSLRGRSR